MEKSQSQKLDASKAMQCKMLIRSRDLTSRNDGMSTSRSRSTSSDLRFCPGGEHRTIINPCRAKDFGPGITRGALQEREMGPGGFSVAIHDYDRDSMDLSQMHSRARKAS